MKPTPANLLMMQFTFLGGSFQGVCIDVYIYNIYSKNKTYSILDTCQTSRPCQIWEMPKIGVPQ